MARKRRNMLLGAGSGPINLGRVQAEKDDSLAQYYIHPEKYLARALNIADPAIVFIGPKGIGKSAILQMIRLTKESEQKRILDIAPDDLAFSALANVDVETPLLRDAGKNQWLFKSLWDYVLSVELLRQEYRDEDLVSKAMSYFRSADEKAAKRLLKLTLGDDGKPQSFTQKIIDLVNEVEIAAKTDSVAVSGSLKLDKVTKTGQLPLLSVVNSVARTLAKQLKHPYYVLIDDLDLHWSDTPTQQAFVAALFLSVRSMSAPPNLKFVVAMRDDIYNRLPLEDKDKSRDNVCRVKWDKDSVKDMLDKRIRVRLGTKAEEIWSRLFEGSAFEVLWKHTTGRPRELIRVASLCLEEARDQGHESVEESDLHVGLHNFSEERIGDLASECRHDYPGLDRLLRRLKGFPKEFGIGKLSELAYQVAVDACEPIGAHYSWAGGYADNPEGLARILCVSGVLLYKPSRTAIPERFDPSEPLPIGDDTWFAVNSMYQPYLGCR
jgi:hypothetical protein